MKQRILQISEKPKSVNKVDTGIIKLNEENTIKFKDKKDK